MDPFLCAAVMSGGERVSREATHRRENLIENQKEMTSTNHQEVGGGALNNVVEKGCNAGSMQKTSFSCRIHHNEESQGILDERGLFDVT